MPIERRVVDNRVLLLGLDELYRGAMERHECGELLACARRVAEVLQVGPADVPVEGYYASDDSLREYFLLMKALQSADEALGPRVSTLPEFRRLKEVATAPLFGRPEDGGMLLPTSRDVLTEALESTFPDWTVDGLTTSAYRLASETDECSLVSLAARARDPVVMAALRESVALYSVVALGEALEPPKTEYVWHVDEPVADAAARFVTTFNALFGENLPVPEARQAGRYWDAWSSCAVVGRCVRMGDDVTTSPVRHYHWAICRDAHGELRVQERWDTEVWTTERYQARLRPDGRCPEL